MPQMLGMKFPIPVIKQSIYFDDWWSTVAAGLTVYLNSLDADEFTSSGYNVAENNYLCNYLVTRSGILRNLVVKSYQAPGGGQTYTYTVRVNGNPTAITCQIAGAGTVNANDLVNAVRVVVGDRVTVQLVTSGAATVSRHKATIGFEVNSLRDFDKFNFSSGTMAAGTSRYPSHTGKGQAPGGFDSNIDVSMASRLITRSETIKNMVALVTVAPGVGQSFIYVLMVNGIATALTLTISGAGQVTGFDSTNVVKVSAGNRICIKETASAAATVTSHLISIDSEEGEYRAG